MAYGSSGSWVGKRSTVGHRLALGDSLAFMGLWLSTVSGLLVDPQITPSLLTFYNLIFFWNRQDWRSESQHDIAKDCTQNLQCSPWPASDDKDLISLRGQSGKAFSHWSGSLGELNFIPNKTDVPTGKSILGKLVEVKSRLRAGKEKKITVTEELPDMCWSLCRIFSRYF